MNFQVTVLKILVSYPDGFATMEDLKRDMAILATSGRDWADRTRRLGARVPGLDIFSQALIERVSGGWRITPKGRAVLELMEDRFVPPLAAAEQPSESGSLKLPPPHLAAEPSPRGRGRRQRRIDARRRARAP